MKYAMTQMEKIAKPPETSKWVTGEIARKTQVHPKNVTVALW